MNPSGRAGFNLQRGLQPPSGPAAKVSSSDAEGRERIRASLDETLIVEAAAGTGKTTELVRRIVEVLASQRAEIQEIAAVTFTHKAAGEMKLRLRQELDRQRQAAEGSRRQALEDALARLEEASIGTIHSFCAQILRERPVEANVDPAFEELTEQEAARIFQQSFRAWLERQLNRDSPGLRRAFARMAWPDPWIEASPFERLQKTAWNLLEWRDYTAAWRREPFARTEEIDTLARMVRGLAEASSHPRRVDDKLYIALRPARDLAQWMEGACSQSRHSRSSLQQSRTSFSLSGAEAQGQAEACATVPGRNDYDALEALLIRLPRELRRNFKKGTGEYGGGVKREDILAQHDELVRWIGEFQVRADAELAALLREEMSPLLEEYSDRKRRQGKLDFVDLLSKVRDLVRGRRDVREYLQKRFKRIFVDEFQDTDPLQVEILLLMCAVDPAQSRWQEARPQPGKLFVVGDPKQSIYKFRRADLDLYRELRQVLQERGAGIATLTQSFRSVRNIQQFINAAFETEMNADVDGHAEWSPLEKHREDPEGHPSVIALPVPKPYRTQYLSKEAVAGCLPDAIAAFVDWLLKESQWGYKQADVAVLFRRRNYGQIDLTRETVRALEARGIAHLLAGSKSLHHREEVETLRAALTAIEWPDDELSVFAALKGSLFAISDEDLFLFRHRHGRLHPFHKSRTSFSLSSPEGQLEADDFPHIREALDLLAGLHRARNRRPFASTVNALLESTRAHAGFLLRPGGQQILANVGRVAELARTYEMTGGISFRGFVEELAAKAEKEEAAEAPVLEEDSDGVRLMTVHGAKGLEFPVVILADLTTGLSRDKPERHIDGPAKLCAQELLGCAPWELREHAAREAAREHAEGVRLAYVAATRAKDLLVIPAVGDEPFPADSWLQPLYKALYPARANWRKSRPAPGCPQFGDSSVVSRPADYDGRPEFSVGPGLVQPQTGAHEVVWWDPCALVFSERHQTSWQDTVMKNALKPDGGASLEAYREWREHRDELLARAAQPAIDLFLASEASAPPPQAIAVELTSAIAAPQSLQRSVGGKRFGALVHAALRDAPLDADREAIQRFVDLNARVLGASIEETKAARAALEAALAHPILARARAAGRLHREYPISLPLPEGRWIEGVIDLAFVEEDRWVVVDFKTDADPPEIRAQYERQLQWYAYALTMLTKMPATAVLLGV